MLGPEQVNAYLQSTSYLPESRVCSHPQLDNFGSQDIPNFHPVHYFLVREGLEATRRATGENRAHSRVSCWTSIYRAGERIAPHRDRSGDVQFLVVLARPPAECGGVLHIVDRDGQERVLDLSPGDGLVFFARGLTHFTEPLVETASCPEPTRVVAVGRYFFAS